jgi:peptidoglycan glycosyltransferase
VNKPIRTISIFCLLLFVALMINATWLQYWKSDAYDKDPRNRRVIEAAYSRERGAILVGREPVAESVESDDEYDFLRTYSEPFKYAHVTGYFSFYDQSGIERSQNDVLSGDDRLLFVTKLVDLLSNKSAQGGSVQLTIDPTHRTRPSKGLEPCPGTCRAPWSPSSRHRQDPRDGVAAELRPEQAGVPRLQRGQTTTTGSTPTRTSRCSTGRSRPAAPGSTFKLVTPRRPIESGNYDADATVPGGATYQLPATAAARPDRQRGPRLRHRQDPVRAGDGPVVQHHLRPARRRAGRRCAAGAGRGVRVQPALPGRHRSAGDLQLPRGLERAEAGQSAIGQFEVQATPLQMAMVGAGIANQAS